MSGDLLAFAFALVRPTERPPFHEDCEDHRHCRCGRTAWFERVDTDGCRLYSCSVGHRIVEYPIAEAGK